MLGRSNLVYENSLKQRKIFKKKKVRKYGNTTKYKLDVLLSNKRKEFTLQIT